MKVIKDIFYTNQKDLSRSLDIYLPECESFPVFVYFHGGGIEGGSKDMGEQIPKELCDCGICFVSAEYRMYPHASYPQFIQDCAAAAAWVHKHINEYGKAEGIYVGGSSAGGYLSMMLMFDERYFAVHKLKPTDFKGYIPDAGQPTVHFNVLRERGIDTRRVIVDEAAPLYHICEKEYPNMLFIVSDNDMENRFEQTKLVESTLKHFRVDESKYSFLYMKDSTHCSYIHKNTPDGKNVFADIVINYIKETENKQ